MTAGVEISKRLLLINAVSSALRRIISITVLIYVYRLLVRDVSSGELKIYGLVVPTMIVIPLLTAVCGSGLRRYVLNAYAKGDTARITMMVSNFASAGTSTPVIGGGKACAVVASASEATHSIRRVHRFEFRRAFITSSFVWKFTLLKVDQHEDQAGFALRQTRHGLADRGAEAARVVADRHGIAAALRGRQQVADLDRVGGCVALDPDPAA